MQDRDETLDFISVSCVGGFFFEGVLVLFLFFPRAYVEAISSKFSFGKSSNLGTQRDMILFGLILYINFLIKHIL